MKTNSFDTSPEKPKECDLGWVACENNPCPRHVEYWKKYHSQVAPTPSSSKLETPIGGQYVHHPDCELDTNHQGNCQGKFTLGPAEAAPKPDESQLEVYSKLLANTRQFLVDAQLSFVDQIRKIDELIGDMPGDEKEIKEISVAPFGLDNDHI